MSAWTEFVKTHYSKVTHLPNKERLAALSKMFKDKKIRGGGTGMDLIADLKRKHMMR